jgi:hypothetical protein
MLKVIGPSVLGNVSCDILTPIVGMYFVSNSPVWWRTTNVVLPTPPSPTRTSFTWKLSPIEGSEAAIVL